MKTKEEKIIEAIGDTKDSNVLRAVGHESADPSLKTEVHHVEFVEAPKISEADVKRYRIRNCILGGLAAAVAITGGVVIWSNLRNIQTEPKPAESSVTEPIVTIYTPDLAVDPLSIITDTSMPEPFAPTEGPLKYDNADGWHDEFNDLWQKRFTSINVDLIEAIGAKKPECKERAEELLTQYQDAQVADVQAGNVTRYGIDDTPNIYRYMKDLGLTGEEMESVLIYYDNEIHRQINEGADLEDRLFDFDSMYFGSENKADIAVAFKSEYSIVSGEYVLSPRWMYYHTAEDYEKVNISATQIRIMLTKYKELGLTDEAWEAFSAKLEEYIEAHKAATEDKRYIIDTVNHDLTSDNAIGILEDVFYGEWEVTEDYKLSFTYESSPFDFEGFHRPLCFAETEDIWYMLCINSGESEIFVIEKSDPEVMYQTGLSYFNGYDSTPVVELGSEMSIKYTRTPAIVHKNLRSGKISRLAEYKLFNIYGEDFRSFFYEVIDGGYTDDFGNYYVQGDDMMTAGADRYLVERGDDHVTLGIRYFKEQEYNDYLNGNGFVPDIAEDDDEPEYIGDTDEEQNKPTEYYFAIKFTRRWNAGWMFSYGNLSDVYADISVQTYRSSQMERYISEVELKDVELRGTNIMFQTARLRVIDTMDEGHEPVETQFGNAYIAGLDGHSCGNDIRVINYGLSNGNVIAAILFPRIGDDDYIVQFFMYDGKKLDSLKDITDRDDKIPSVKDINDITVVGNSINVYWADGGMSGGSFVGDGKPFAYVSGN